MARKGGLRSDDQRKAMFANMALRMWRLRNPKFSSPNIFSGKDPTKDEENKSPANRLVIPPKLKAVSILEKCRKLQKSGSTPTLSNISKSENREDTLKILNELHQKGYIKLVQTEKDTEIRILPGGYADAIKSSKEEYKQYLTSNVNLDNVIEEVQKSRKTLIEYEQSLIEGQREVGDYLAKCIEQGYDAENGGYDEKRYISMLSATANALKINQDKIKINEVFDDFILTGGSRKLLEDVNYVLDNYFDIDPRLLSDNYLFVLSSSEEDRSSELVSFGYNEIFDIKGTDSTKRESQPTDFIIRINERHQDYVKGNDVKKDKIYLDALVDGVAQWLREVDMGRTYLELSSNRFKIREPEKWKNG